MAEILLSIIVAIFLYLVPGYLVVNMLNFRDSSGIVRLILSLCISLVIVPFSFILTSNIYSFRPNLVAWVVLVAFLIVLNLLTNHSQFSLKTDLKTRYSEPLKFPKLEKWGVLIFLLLYAAIANLPRFAMFIQGNHSLVVSPWDVNWHLPLLTSVTRTGLPPNHYLFPSLKLAYYYASWIYPAILGNLPVFPISLARAMAIHGYVQILAFLFIIYLFISLNFKEGWIRLIGLLFFTIMGGFDFYVNLPEVNQIDWWQTNVGWLVNGIQISQFITYYAWVPQHLAGGMAFLFLLFIWKNLNTIIEIKILFSSMVFTFIFATSPFIFLFSIILTMLLLISNIRSLWKNRWKVLYFGSIGVVIFVVAVWDFMITYLAHRGGITWGNIFIPIFSSYENSIPNLIEWDRIITIFGFPLFFSFILLIEIGLPFILYIAWWFTKFFSGKSIYTNNERIVLGIFPLISFFLIFFFRDDGGGGNFSMRGVLPAQILIVFASLFFISDIGKKILLFGWKKWVLIYIFFCFIVSQGISAFAEIYDSGRESVSIILQNDCSLLSFPMKPNDDCYDNDPYQYIHWLNLHTPRNALILETGPITSSGLNFRWLERIRFLDPDFASQLDLAQLDKDYLLLHEWSDFIETNANSTGIIEWYRTTYFRDKENLPVYVVVWLGGETPAIDGVLVYRDGYVNIYRYDIAQEYY